jgi:porphobilinogen synthase
MRRLVAETSLEPRHLVLPMFVADGIDEPRPISAMPGVVQHTRASLRAAAADAVAAGVGAGGRTRQYVHEVRERKKRNHL